MGSATRLGTAALLAAALVAAGCSADDAATVARDAPDEAPAMEFDAGEDGERAFDEPDADAPPAPEPGQAGAGDPARPASATLGRTVIRTAEIDLVASDPAVTVDEVTRIAEEAGGFVATADLRRDRDGVLSGTVTMRVPAADLLATLDTLDDLVEGAASRRIDEQDVTIEVADLRARLANLTTYEAELNQLLADVRQTTVDPDDLLRVFERVRSVREEIDLINGRLTVLSDQVSLATITVRITPAPQAVPVSDPGWRPGDTLHAATTSLARTLAALTDGLIWFTIAVLPVLTIVLAPFALAGGVWWRRSRRRQAEAAAASAPTAPPPA